MPAVVRDGVRLYYTDEGQGDAVLLHTGAAGDGRMWELAGYARLLAGYRRLVTDHRGHGQSDKPTGAADHRLSAYVADVVSVLDDAGVERAALVGYSSGATILYRVAAQHPDRCSALVAIGAPPRPDESPETTGDAVREIGVAVLMELLSGSEAEPAPRWLVENLSATPTEMFALMLDAWVSEPSAWEDLGRITAPTLLVSGEAEAREPDVAAAADRLLDGESVVLPGYGHLQTFWHAETAGHVIADFLARKLSA